MPMTEYELSLFNGAKEGKKKCFDRLYHAYHKPLCEIIDFHIGDRSRAETLLRAVFEKVKDQMHTVVQPTDFEDLLVRLTEEECQNYLRDLFMKAQGQQQ